MDKKAFQEYYPDNLSHCFGCGRLNDQGLQIKSYWDDSGVETRATFSPQPHYTSIPGFVYGGLIASLIDCHGTGTAAAAAYQTAGRSMDDGGPPLRYVTASLQVEYLHPTPLETPIHLRGKITEIKGRKVIVEIQISANGQITARGKVIAVQVPDHWSPVDGE